MPAGDVRCRGATRLRSPSHQCGQGRALWRQLRSRLRSGRVERSGAPLFPPRRRSLVVEGVRVDYWGIDEDVVGFVGHEAAATREFLTPYANSTIRDPYSVKLIPTRETAGIVACQFVAFANSRDEHAPFIGIWQLWLSPGLDRVS